VPVHSLIPEGTLLRLLGAFGLMALMTAPAAAQSTAAVAGTVTDSAGRPVPHASVHIPGTNYFASTDVAGRYRLDRLPVDLRLERLPAGLISVRATLVGYRSLQRDSLVLVPGRTTQVDFRLFEGPRVEPSLDLGPSAVPLIRPDSA
jgi:carboxypeptidase family protein